jgi:rRNA maturation protein Nop10
MLQLQWTGFDRRLTASCLKCGRDAEQPADRRFDPDDAPSREFRSMAASNRGLRYV